MYVDALKNRKLLLFGGLLLLSVLLFVAMGNVAAADHIKYHPIKHEKFVTCENKLVPLITSDDMPWRCKIHEKAFGCPMLEKANELTLSNARLKSTVEKQGDEIQELKESNNQLVDSNNQLVDSNNQLNRTVEKQGLKIQQLEADNNQLKADNNQLNKTVQNLKSELRSQNITIQFLNRTVERLDADNKDINNRLDTVIASNKELIGLNNKLNENNAKLVVYYANWGADNATQQAEINRLTAENKDLREQIKNISDKIEELNKKLNRKIVFLSGNNLNMNFKDGSKYSVKLTDKDDSPVPNETVVITVNGKIYEPRTNDDGIASLPIALSPGTYTITATHGRTVSNTITIK